ncbi:hypothetical protein [Niabella drilacis]|uniref:YD repeat-containing protein n=1 Tax=Niabella drilacis (strain DSM 25811 / CCM 8410 / CCUG 62505 / LMG 26954 / E90) TaxID=1285928 RepID=A0A1G7B8Y6_NIADE|nr:hypothetical protein [Niabella drilacis]SDE23501.1 YD repeat-containing protein [Niabella drilacis]
MKYSIILLALLFVFGFAGCKKDEAGTRPACRIKKIDEPRNITTMFSYDAQGRLQSVNHNGSITSFTYIGDSIIKQGVWKSVYALNRNGLVAFERREYNSSGTQWETRAYEYNGMQLKKMTAKSHSGNFIRTFTWSNGNMVLEHTEGNLYTQDITYEYYTGKPYSPGDVQSWDLWENGVETIRNKNLLKRYSSIFSDYRNPDPSAPPGTPAVEKDAGSYTYIFDGNGTITAMTASSENSSDLSTYTYEYQCN